MNFFATFVIFTVCSIQLALAGLIDIKWKVKLSATRHDSEACPPGVWSCQTEKRSEVGDGWRDISDAAVLFFNKRALKMNIESMDSSFKNKRDVENCPPGMWACKTKMMLKQMVLTAIGKSQPSTGRVAKRERERDYSCLPGVCHVQMTSESRQSTKPMS